MPMAERPENRRWSLRYATCANSESVQERQRHSKSEQKQLVYSGYSDLSLSNGFHLYSEPVVSSAIVEK